MCADLHGLPRLQINRAEELMELVDIKYAQNKLVKQLSGGMKQKASGASSIHQPDILFLDEPTIGLNPTTKRVLWDLVEKELNSEGRTIILCSHDMYEVELLCDRLESLIVEFLLPSTHLVALKTPMIHEQKEVGNLPKHLTS